MSIVSAYNNPPPPNVYARAASVNADGDPDEGDPDDGPDFGGAPDMPIDQNKIMLLVSGLALGAVVIYRKQIKKASN
ncbi:hypothetical protein [Flavobacterium sp.]|uniref:hypothetical protein n=1 Tax=Flavobacterium sp. TaxID=239 RepID=UPI002ED7AF72